MKAWHRAKFRLHCGFDPQCWVEEGDPYLLLSGEGWQKVRCAEHAGLPAPELVDEPRPLSLKTPNSFVPARELAKVLPEHLKRDVRQLQTGDDE